MPEPTDPTMQAALAAGEAAYDDAYEGSLVDGRMCGNHDDALKAAIVAAVEKDRKRYAGLVEACDDVIRTTFDGALPPHMDTVHKLRHALERLKESKP